jgi:Phage integrase SAM-like domain
MIKTHFYPKQNGHLQPYSVLQILITIDGKKHLQVSTGVKITNGELKYWANGRIIEKQQGTPLYKKINDHLDRMRKVIKDAYDREENIREALDRMNGKKVKEKPVKISSFYELLDSLCRGEIKKKGFDLADNSIKNYKYLRSVLTKYDRDKVLTFEDFSVLEWNRLHSWLQKNTLKKFKNKKGLGANSIATICATLRSTLNCGVGLKLTNSIQHRESDFTAAPAKVNSIYLTTEEIEKLYNLKIEDKTLKLVRDYFVLATQTGARFSDWGKLNPDNYIEAEGDTYLEFTPKKTKRHENEAVVLLTPLFKKIMDSYGGRMPSLPHYNTIILGLRKVCAMAGLKNAALVTSKVGRTSLVTNKFMEGMSTTTIKTITAHRSNAFEKYLKVGKPEAKKLQKKHADEIRFGGLKAV